MFNKFKVGNIVKIITGFDEWPQNNFPQNLITEVVSRPHTFNSLPNIYIKGLRNKLYYVHVSHFIKASKRETFLYHILGPYVSEEE